MAKRERTATNLREGFPKVTYRVSSPQGSHCTCDTLGEAEELAKRLMAIDYVCRKWVAIDEITVRRVFVEVGDKE